MQPELRRPLRQVFDANLQPVAAALNLSVTDPNSFTVARTTVVADATGVASWAVPTSTEPTLGTWTLTATTAAGDATQSRTFSLAEYTLPTFSVSVQPAAGYLLPSSAAAAGAVTAAFTSGAPVQGTVTINLYQQSSLAGGSVGLSKLPGAGVAGAAASPAPGGGAGPTATLLATSSAPISGSAQYSLQLPAAGSKLAVAWGSPLLVQATVTDGATGETQSAAAVVATSTAPFTAAFSGPAAFKPGLPWRGMLTVANPDGTPRDGPATVAVSALYAGNATPALPPTLAVTVAGGAAPLSLTVPLPPPSCCTAGAYSPTSCCVTSLRLTYAPLGGASATASSSGGAAPYATLSVPAAAAAAGVADYLDLGPQSVASGAPSWLPASTQAGAAVSWALLGAGGVLKAGVAAPGSALALGPLPSPQALGPSPTLLAFVSAGGGLAMDWAPLSVSAALPLSVIANFSQSACRPGDAVAARAVAAPGAAVFFTAVDASLDLLSVRLGLSASTMDPAALLAQAAAATSAAATSLWQQPRWGFSGCWGAGTPADSANALVFSPASLPACTVFRPGGVMLGLAAGAVAAAAIPAASADSAAKQAAAATAAPAVRVRTLFPETWLWLNATAGAGGSVTVPTTAPDTITSWRLSAWASLPGTGVGVAANASLSVSQPLYITPSLPYSVVRNETVTLPVGVYSNVSQALSVTVSLAAAPWFVAASALTVTVVVPPRGSGSAAFAVTAVGLGTQTIAFSATTGDPALADATQRSLLVVAEGFPVSVTQTALVNGSSTVTLSSPLPAGYVNGSEAATLSVVGDLMGTTLQNLGNLIQVPFGCGGAWRPKPIWENPGAPRIPSVLS